MVHTCTHDSINTKDKAKDSKSCHRTQKCDGSAMHGPVNEGRIVVVPVQKSGRCSYDFRTVGVFIHCCALPQLCVVTVLLTRLLGVARR